VKLRSPSDCASKSYSAVTVSVAGMPLSREGLGLGGGGAAPFDFATEPHDVVEVAVGDMGLLAGPGL
jgi:hypothetical protein